MYSVTQGLSAEGGPAPLPRPASAECARCLRAASRRFSACLLLWARSADA